MSNPFDGNHPLKRQKLDAAPDGYEAGAGRGAKPIMGIRPDNFDPAQSAQARKRAHKQAEADGRFGAQPAGYVPGRGRGATGFVGGVSRDEVDREGEDKTDLADGNYDEFSGYGGSLFGGMAYDHDDEEADKIYSECDNRLDERRAKWREQRLKDDLKKIRAEKPTIKQQFADLRRDLVKVSEEEWSNIPEAQEHLKVKDRKRGNNSFLADPMAGMGGGSKLRSEAGQQTPMGAATPMGMNTPMIRGGMNTPMGMSTPMGMNTPMGMRGGMMGGMNTPMGMRGGMMGGMSTPMGMNTPMSGMSGMSTPMGAMTPMAIAEYRKGNRSGAQTPMSGAQTPMSGAATPNGMQTPSGMSSAVGHSSIHDVAAAKEHGLALKLHQLESKVSNQARTDAGGYMTDLHARSGGIGANDAQEINKTRALMTSVTQSNPKHAPGWIAAARVEELAGRLPAAKEMIAQGTRHCPNDVGVWIEAARLEKGDAAKSVIAQGVKLNQYSVELWLAAANLETDKVLKSKVLRKALDMIPNSKKLWEEAVALEDPQNAKVLLLRAVQCCPGVEEMWLALAKLCSFKDAQTILNEARKKIPRSERIWVNAAKLQEKCPHLGGVDPEKIFPRALDSLKTNGQTLARDVWLKHAEESEKSGYPKTCAAIVNSTILIGLEKMMAAGDTKGVKRIWIGDASNLESSGSIGTARAIYEAAVGQLPNKKGLWRRYCDLEMKHGSRESLDKVLARATDRCPEAEVLWLMRAKQKWLGGDIDAARQVLSDAFRSHEDSEQINLAAAKIEMDGGQMQRGRLLLARARKLVPNSAKIWQQSIQLEREARGYAQAKALAEEALAQFPKAATLWMIAGQLIMEEASRGAGKNNALAGVEEAGKMFAKGLVECPKSVELWLCAVDCELQQKRNPKARALLEKARLKNPASPMLWYRGVQVEELDGNTTMAMQMMNRGLQECANSGVLWAKAIEIEPKTSRQAKSVDGLKACENDAMVQMAVAQWFWEQKQIPKARKWLQRATAVNPKLGDVWGLSLAFELLQGGLHEQREIIYKCMEADPKQGVHWPRISKRVENWRKKPAQKLKEYVMEVHAETWKKVVDKLEPEIAMLLDGKPQAEAREATRKKVEKKRQSDNEKEERRFTFKVPFIATDVFKGKKEGYVFKLGFKGQGYYEDVEKRDFDAKKERESGNGMEF